MWETGRCVLDEKQWWNISFTSHEQEFGKNKHTYRSPKGSWRKFRGLSSCSPLQVLWGNSKYDVVGFARKSVSSSVLSVSRSLTYQCEVEPAVLIPQKNQIFWYHKFFWDFGREMKFQNAGARFTNIYKGKMEGFHTTLGPRSGTEHKFPGIIAGLNLRYGNLRLAICLFKLSYYNKSYTWLCTSPLMEVNSWRCAYGHKFNDRIQTYGRLM